MVSDKGYLGLDCPAVDEKSMEAVDRLFYFCLQTILLGDSGVGKTSLLVQFDTGKFQLANFAATVGIGFTVRSIFICLFRRKPVLAEALDLHLECRHCATSMLQCMHVCKHVRRRKLLLEPDETHYGQFNICRLHGNFETEIFYGGEKFGALPGHCFSFFSIRIE